MNFKVDENLPSEAGQMLRQAGHDAVSAIDQGLGGRPDAEVASVCKSESRTLLTLDADFANILVYPPGEYAGIVVIRTDDQAKPAVLGLVGQLVRALAAESPMHRLWIVEHNRIRVRGSD